MGTAGVLIWVKTWLVSLTLVGGQIHLKKYVFYNLLLRMIHKEGIFLKSFYCKAICYSFLYRALMVNYFNMIIISKNISMSPIWLLLLTWNCCCKYSCKYRTCVGNQFLMPHRVVSTFFTVFQIREMFQVKNLRNLASLPDKLNVKLKKSRSGNNQSYWPWA